MATSNPWLTPYQRSFNDIKDKILQELRVQVPEITDLTEGNIFVLIISIFAAMVEVLHYYIDNAGREAFVTTARRYSSLYKHAKLVDYKVKAAVPPSVDLTLYLKDDKPLKSDLSIPASMEFKSKDNKLWITSKTVIWPEGNYSVKVPVVQKEKISRKEIGNITNREERFYITGLPQNKFYVEGSLVLYINKESWIQVDTFAYSTAWDKTYKVEVDENMKPYIQFGDGQFGMKPPLNAIVEISCYVTTGAAGNVPENSFESVPQNILNFDKNIKVTNTYAATGGSDYESFNMLKDHIPLAVKTLGVAVTKDDYEAFARMVPGVDKAYVFYECQRAVKVYITPDGGGEASRALLDEVESRLGKSKVITTSIEALSTHRSLIYLQAEVYGRRSFNRNDIGDQVKKALLDNYNYNTSDINKVVRLSDIYALIDNCDMVDYLKIHKLYLVSFPKATINPDVSPELNITSFIQDFYKGAAASVNDEGIEKVYGEKVTVVITKDGFNIKDRTGTNVNGTYGEPAVFKSSLLGFTITISNEGSVKYNVGEEYYFYLQAMNQDLTPVDYNIPIFYSNSIQLTIHEVV